MLATVLLKARDKERTVDILEWFVSVDVIEYEYKIRIGNSSIILGFLTLLLL